MKKLLITTLTLLLLCGCASKDNNSKISSNEVLFTGNGKEFTENDLYKVLKLSATDAISFALITKIGEIEEIDLTQVNEEIEQMASVYLNMGYDEFTVETAKENWLYSGIVFELAKKYIESDLDNFVKQDSPIQLQIASFTDYENAEKALKDISKGSTFDMAVLNNGFEGNPSPVVYLDSDETLVYEVKDYINSTDTTGVSSIITSTVTTQDNEGNNVETNTYYLINIVSRNVNDFKDDYLEVKANTFEMNDIINKYFEKHEIVFYDQDIYELMTNEYEVLK